MASVKIFKKSCDFITAAAHGDQLPPPRLPEAAFVGRSNVGKSSLINSLVYQNSLARTSNTPGRTQQINFFNLADKIMLVDLPGYGFAKVPKHQKKAWDTLINTYLKGRPNLKRVCLLIDARHPLKPSDEEMMCMMDKAAVSYIIALTKADAVKKMDLDTRHQALIDKLPKHTAAYPEVLITSTKNGWGLDDVRAHLAGLGK